MLNNKFHKYYEISRNSYVIRSEGVSTAARVLQQSLL